MELTATQFTRAMKALSEPNRVEIVRLVGQKQGESGIPCTAILADLDISQSTFSHHVGELREAELLLATPNGRSVLLKVNQELIDAVQNNLKNLF